MKINKTLIILSLLLIFCITLGTVSATEDIMVNDTATDDSVATVESSPINEEINTVGDGEIHNSSEIYSEINLAIDTYYIEYDYQIDQTWDIFVDIIIDGQGHTIYGNWKQAFNIEGTGITIRNFNFVNCSVNDKGGAIYFVGNGVSGGSVSSCSFVNCSDNNGSYPVFKSKVILTVEDVKGVSGSTVKVDVGVHDILGTPVNEGTVTISLNGKEYTAKVVDAVATFNIIIPSKESIYSANVFFNAEGKYDNATCNFTVTSIFEDNNTNASDNDTRNINKSVVSNKINNMENCGTPLIALLIALISLPLIRRK